MKKRKNGLTTCITGIGICLQLYTPSHYILYSILSIFGHDARLPVDNILSSPGDQMNSPEEWVQLHHYRMQEAVRCANINRIKLKAAEW